MNKIIDKAQNSATKIGQILCGMHKKESISHYAFNFLLTMHHATSCATMHASWRKLNISLSTRGKTGSRLDCSTENTLHKHLDLQFQSNQPCDYDSIEMKLVVKLIALASYRHLNLIILLKLRARIEMRPGNTPYNLFWGISKEQDGTEQEDLGGLSYLAVLVRLLQQDDDVFFYEWQNHIGMADDYVRMRQGRQQFL